MTATWERDIVALCELAQRHDATVEVDQKRDGAGRHPMLRISFGGKSELMTVSLTSRYALVAKLKNMKRVLRNLGAIKHTGPGEERERRRRTRFDRTPFKGERAPTPIRRTFRDQLRDWKFHNTERAA
jgi:hypothetical protein